MRYAVLADVHSNTEALTAVLQDLKNRKIRDIFFLGDAVGYGPDPDACIDRLKSECSMMIAGNHDWGVCGLTDTSFFNAYAKAAIEWTGHSMKKSHIEMLRTLPLSAELQERDSTIVHSTPHDPEEWHYLTTYADAELNFNYFQSRRCFIGHSHRPVIIEKRPSGEIVTYKDTAIIRPDSRYIINVGSVGQPRDGDPRTAYAVSDDETVLIIRVPYDIQKTQHKMSLAGLPVPLITRLSAGM